MVGRSRENLNGEIAGSKQGDTLPDTLLMIGRIIFSMMFVGSGIGHLMDSEGTAQYVESKGLGNAKLLAQGSGVALLAGGLGLLLGIWTDLAFAGIGILVLIMAFVMHPFWGLEGEVQQMEMSGFMKNLTIAGACLMGFTVHAYGGYNARQIVGPLLELTP